jgi:molybdopterin-guanine dinucleotide biosynthesis protein A
MPTAIILAGGRGRRLGRDKASAIAAGTSLLQHVIDRTVALVDSTLIVTRAGQQLPPFEGERIQVVEDELPASGPLAGLYSGLRAAPSFPALAVACDMPLLQPALLAELLRRVEGHDAAVALRDGQPEPLCAAYAAGCIDVIGLRLRRGELRTMALLDDVDVVYLAEQDWRRFDPQGLSFFNVNTPDDLQAAEQRLRAASARSRQV